MKKSDRDKFEQTYGLFKFKLPSPEEQIAAMDLIGESMLVKKLISLDYERFYDNLTAPEYGDWLMNHKEYGQTYQEFIRSGVVPVESERDTVYLAPLVCGEHEIDQGFINALVIICQSYFHGMKVKLFPKKLDLKENIEVKVSDKGRKNIQINANEILNLLYSELPSDAFCMVGFTEKDLYNNENILKPRDYIYKRSEKKTTSFCYGLSSVRNRVSVFTFTRYDPLYYINPKKDDREQERLMKYYFILLKRACKVAINEILHLFGLRNCTFFLCNLNGFNTMDEFDKRPLEVCPVCLRKLYAVICQKGTINFRNTRISNPIAIYERFIKMYECLTEYFGGLFDYEIEWYKSRVESLNKEL
jgi:archaemetzincin